MSHRCADMKKLVPQLMGVSKAILENVIFCHQEVILRILFFSCCKQTNMSFCLLIET